MVSGDRQVLSLAPWNKHDLSMRSFADRYMSGVHVCMMYNSEYCHSSPPGYMICHIFSFSTLMSPRTRSLASTILPCQVSHVVSMKILALLVHK